MLAAQPGSPSEPVRLVNSGIDLQVHDGRLRPAIGVENIPAGPGTGGHVVMAKHSSTWETLALTLFFPPLAYVAKTRRASDQFAKVHFDDTVIDYRDDNRHLWVFIEDSDDEEFFDAVEQDRVRFDAVPANKIDESEFRTQLGRRTVRVNGWGIRAMMLEKA